jgi:CTP synthase (UTP-ammonia lyase)
MQVAIIGDYDADFEPHRATEAAISHAAEFLRAEIEVTWIATDSIGEKPQSQFARFGAFWIAPGSPYRSLAGALAAIRCAREQDMPLLGTCGGLQHMIVEFARNVLGLADATHAEYDPNASMLFVTPLSCSLAGKEMQVTITPGSRAAIAYGVLQATERYYCNFGLNPAYQSQLHDGGFRIVGVDADDEARILEIPQHIFFVGTLFVPQARSKPGAPHPLVVAFLQAAIPISRA